ncbi:MAG: alpha/beta hydrolase family protein [Reyranella sp.]
MRSSFKKFIVPVLACVFVVPAFAQSPGPQDAERSTNREQVWRIPAAGGSPLMLSTVMRPKGEARAPLVVINHGSPAESSARPQMSRQRYSALSSWFVAHGYVVAVPLRRGYGETGGAWAEDYGPCNNPDYAGAGLQTAADIKAAIDFMRTQPFVVPDHTIVVGQSAGGWGTIALSSLNPPGVSGMIDFAGGRGGHQRMSTGGTGNCATSALVQAAAKYGATARVPMLWIYAANDTFFEPGLARRMVDAYNGAGGHATLQAVGPNGQEGHNLATSPDGPAVWSPLVEAFLRTLR